LATSWKNAIASSYLPGSRTACRGRTAPTQAQAGADPVERGEVPAEVGLVLLDDRDLDQPLERWLVVLAGDGAGRDQRLEVASGGAAVAFLEQRLREVVRRGLAVRARPARQIEQRERRGVVVAERVRDLASSKRRWPAALEVWLGIGSSLPSWRTRSRSRRAACRCRRRERAAGPTWPRRALRRASRNGRGQRERGRSWLFPGRVRLSGRRRGRGARRGARGRRCRRRAGHGAGFRGGVGLLGGSREQPR